MSKLNQIKREFQQFFGGYMECVEFTETPIEPEEGSDEDPIDEVVESMDNNNIAKALADAASFFASQYDLLSLAAEQVNYTWEHAGHDLWVTRNGHGVGFWDGDLQVELDPALYPTATPGTDLGDELTKWAKVESGVDIYAGDDGAVYYGN